MASICNRQYTPVINAHPNYSPSLHPYCNMGPCVHHNANDAGVPLHSIANHIGPIKPTVPVPPVEFGLPFVGRAGTHVRNNTGKATLNMGTDGVASTTMGSNLPLRSNTAQFASIKPAHVSVPQSPISFGTPFMGAVGTPIRNNTANLSVGYSGVHVPSPVNTCRSFVPKTYTTSIYSPDGKVTYRSGVNLKNPPCYIPRSFTAQFQPVNQRQVNNVKFKPRKPNRGNSINQGRMESDRRLVHRPSILSNINTEAVQIFEGFVSSTFNAFRTLVGELRNDVINGLFKSDDPDYDAAKEYYYASITGRPRVPKAGLTQRIDYIEAISNYKLVNEPNDAVLGKEPAISNREYSSSRFMNMTEQELEAFLLSDSYLNVPPPSIPR